MSVQSVELSDAILPLADYAAKVREEPIIITDKGQPIAAVVSLPNTHAETITLSQSPEFLAIIERSRVRQSQEGGRSSAEMRRRFFDSPG
jgi:antitoxin (DNA-binding transcriptional repressor) of toxin-antitoxin stability system